MSYKNILLFSGLLGWTGCQNDSAPQQNIPAPLTITVQTDSMDSPAPVLPVVPPNKTTQDEKEAVCRQLLDALWMASDHRLEKKKPLIQLTQSTSSAGAYVRDSSLILIEEKAFDICRALGDQEFMPALAFIIAHELAHHFQSNTLKTGFLAYKSNFLGYDHVPHAYGEFERNADLSGAFNMHLAGIALNSNTLDILIAALYDHYKEAKNSIDYPTPQERKNTERLVRQQLTELVALYEAAAIFSAIGEEEAAICAWEAVLHYYEGQEVYANLGTAEARKALRLLAKRDRKWRLIFPLETDWQSRLSPHPKAMGGSEDPYELLGNAEKHLQQALAMNPRYETAALNLFIVRILNDQKHKYLKELVEEFEGLKQQTNREAQHLSLNLALANAYHLRGKNDASGQSADSLWNRVATGPDTLLSLMARYNQRIKVNPAVGTWPQQPLPSSIDVEKNIDGIVLADFKPTLEPLRLVPNCKGAYLETANSRVLVFKMDKKNSTTLQRIPLKTSVTNEQHPHAQRLSANGSLFVVPSQRIGYRIDKGKIVEYFKYQISP